MRDPLDRKRNALLVICKTIITDEKIRRFAPLSVELLESEMRNYREIEAIVAREMAQ